MSKFNAGDRVVNTIRFPNEPIKRGVITRVYNSWKDYLGQQAIMYAVLWDGDTNESVGYMEIANGLEIEQKT